MSSWGFLKKDFIVGLFLMIVLFVTAYFVYDILFSPPTIHKGIIVDKVFVPGRNMAGPNSVTGARYRSFKYNISTQAKNQWIAFVKDEAGQLLKVSCKSDHYDSKNVGDTLLFKEYRGQVFKVEYFSHNDEDADSLDLKANHLR